MNFYIFFVSFLKIICRYKQFIHYIFWNHHMFPLWYIFNIFMQNRSINTLCQLLITSFKSFFFTLEICFCTNKADEQMCGYCPVLLWSRLSKTSSASSAVFIRSSFLLSFDLSEMLHLPPSSPSWWSSEPESPWAICQTCSKQQDIPEPASSSLKEFPCYKWV